MSQTTLTLSIDGDKADKVHKILESQGKSIRGLKLGKLIEESFDKIIAENTPPNLSEE